MIIIDNLGQLRWRLYKEFRCRGKLEPVPGSSSRIKRIYLVPQENGTREKGRLNIKKMLKLKVGLMILKIVKTHEEEETHKLYVTVRQKTNVHYLWMRSDRKSLFFPPQII